MNHFNVFGIFKLSSFFLKESYFHNKLILVDISPTHSVVWPLEEERIIRLAFLIVGCSDNEDKKNCHLDIFFKKDKWFIVNFVDLYHDQYSVK